MCKTIAQGGQRCASHTRKALKQAIKRFEGNATAETFDAVQKARAEYASTPSGRVTIQKKIDRLPTDSPAVVDLTEALRRGALIRERNTMLAQGLRARGSATDRLALAAQPGTGSEVLERMYFTDPLTQVRYRALRSPEVTDAMLTHGARQSDPMYRLAVAEHDRTDSVLLGRLRNDESPMVREAAEENLARRQASAPVYRGERHLPDPLARDRQTRGMGLTPLPL